MLAVILVGLGLALIAAPVFVRAFRAIHREHTEALFRNDAVLAEIARIEKRDEQFFARWDARLQTGATLSLLADKRMALLRGDTIHNNERSMVFFYPLRDEVSQWCNASLAHPWGVVPLRAQYPIASIWFASPSDATAFKLRWY